MQATTIDANDNVSGSRAQGQVNGGADTYRYPGNVTAFENEGPVDLVVDGKTVYSSE